MLLLCKRDESEKTIEGKCVWSAKGVGAQNFWYRKTRIYANGKVHKNYVERKSLELCPLYHNLSAKKGNSDRRKLESAKFRWLEFRSYTISLVVQIGNNFIYFWPLLPFVFRPRARSEELMVVKQKFPHQMPDAQKNKCNSRQRMQSDSCLETFSGKHRDTKKYVVEAPFMFCLHFYFMHILWLHSSTFGYILVHFITFVYILVLLCTL